MLRCSLVIFSLRLAFPYFVLEQGACPPKGTEMSNERIKELEDAIREHRDQKGDDRCWLDDQKLYRAIGGDADLSLPPKHDFLKSCDRYWEQRQSLCDKFAMKHPTIGQLNRQIEALTAQRDALLAVAQKAFDYLDGNGPLGGGPNLKAELSAAIKAAALPHSTESPACTNMFEAEKGGE